MPLGVGLVVIALFLVIGLPGAIIENIIENPWGILQMVLTVGGIIGAYAACFFGATYLIDAEKGIVGTIMLIVCGLVTISPVLFIIWLVVDFIRWFLSVA